MCEDAADRIVTSLLKAKKGCSALTARINGIAHRGWSEWLAVQILKGIEVALKAGKEMNAAIAAAYDKTWKAAIGVRAFCGGLPYSHGRFSLRLS